MNKTIERRDSPLRELEWRWLRARYDEAAIAQAQAQLRNNASKARAVAQWLHQHHGGPAMPHTLSALQTALDDKRAQDTLKLWVEKRWIGWG